MIVWLEGIHWGKHVIDLLYIVAIKSSGPFY